MAKRMKSKTISPKDHLSADNNLTSETIDLNIEKTSRSHRSTRSKRKVSRLPSKSSNHKCSAKSFQVEEHFEDIFKVLVDFQRNNKHCDLMIKTKGGVVYAHSIVIMAATPSLCTTLDKLGSDDKGDKMCLDLSHVSHWIVEDFIAFIYSGNLQLIDTNISEFSKFIKSVGLIKLDKEIDFTSAELPNKLHGPIDETTFRKKGIPLTKCLKWLNSTCSVAQDFKPLKQCKSARKLRNNDCQEPAHDKPVKHETKNEDTMEDELLDAQILPNKQSPVNQKKLEKPSLTETSKDELISVIKPSTKGNEMSEQESGQWENDLPKTEELPEDEEDSYELSENNDSDSETDVEYSPPNKSAKLSNLDKHEALEDSANKTSSNSTNMLCCKRCSATFDSASLLKRHRKTCKGNRPRKRCILCQVSFATAEDYAHHRQTDEKCLDIQNQKRRRRLARKAELRARYSCRVCPRKFRRVADHIDHEFVAHELPYDKKQWPDLYCEVSHGLQSLPASPKRAERNMRRRPFWEAGRGHKQWNTYCQYWTMNPWRLHHHKTYDCSKGQDYICDVCGNKYKNEKTLKCHKEMQHTDAMPLLSCDQCGKTLKGHKGLKHHVRIMHRGENPHKRHMCHFCSMKYASSGDLTFHLHRAHSQPLPQGFLTYQCEDCDYVINNKRTYEKHRQLHQDQRDYHCERCPKAFKTKNSLHNHMKSHVGKKMPCPYDGCSYSALKNCHLKSHIRNQHTQKGVKNEECHVCSYSTFFRGNLLKHLRTVHQLEVVTRYSVQMKAKYKHLKTGHIVGKMDNSDITSLKKKTAVSRSETAEDNANVHSTSNMECNLGDNLHGGQVVNSSEGFIHSSRETGQGDASHERYEAEGQVVGEQGQVVGEQGQVAAKQGQVASTVHSHMLQGMQPHRAPPSSMTHAHPGPYLYAVNSMHAANMNHSGAHDMTFMYGAPPGLQGAAGSQMSLSVPHPVPHVAPHEAPVREPDMTTMSQVLSDNGKLSSGIASLPLVFHPQVTNDEDNNAKMLTYLQI